MKPEEYWKEALYSAFETAGEEKVLSEMQPEVIEDIANQLEISHENYGMAFYEPTGGPDPEIEKLSKRVRELEIEVQEAWGSFRKNVAMRRNVDESQVEVGKNGAATYFP